MGTESEYITTHTLRISDEDERLKTAYALIKNGYNVWLGKVWVECENKTEVIFGCKYRSSYDCVFYQETKTVLGQKELAELVR